MDDWRQRLRRLGIVTGRDFRPRPPHQRGLDIEALVDGEVMQTPAGTCFHVRRVFDTHTPHGTLSLGSWLAVKADTLAHLGDDEALAHLEQQRFLFLDVETTGLGGASLAFLVGVGFFNGASQLEVHQYFLRDPAEETAMLLLLREVSHSATALVTFNGRTFDVPLLASRYVLARQPTPLADLPNLDLLPPARRLWRRRLSSCALSSLEHHVLGVQRTAADVPGYLIPALYQRYLQTRDAREMVRVLYHNEMDLLSMVTLGAALGRAFEHPTLPSLPFDDRLSLARWYERRGMWDRAEAAYRLAADEALDAEQRHEALAALAYLFKRQGRHKEALPLWADLAELRLDTLGHEEIAKYHEWHSGDLEQALLWTERGIHLAASWWPGWRRTAALNTLGYRRQRLLRKLAGRAVNGPLQRGEDG